VEQIEVVSQQTLDALKSHAKIVKVIGDADAIEHVSIFCRIEDDYLELLYSELEGNYIRHFEDEDEFLSTLESRKSELGEDELDDLMDFKDDESFSDDDIHDDVDDLDIREDDD
jgi:hypothetical protein